MSVVYIIFAVVMWLVTLIFGLGAIAAPFVEDGGFGAFLGMAIFASVTGFIGWLLFRVGVQGVAKPSNQPAARASYSQPPVVGFPDGLGSDSGMPEDLTAEIIEQPDYQIDYIDSKGATSSRKIRVSRIKRKNAYVYVDAIDLDKHENRTFRADRIDYAVDADTGELIPDAYSYFEEMLEERNFK